MSPGLGLMLTLGHPCWLSHWGCTKKSKEWWQGLPLVPGPSLLGSSNYCGYDTASHVFLKPTEGHLWGINSPLDPSKPPTYPTCVSAPELQPTYPEILALWNAPLLVWSLGLSGDTHPPLSSIALCSQPLSLSQAPQAVSYPEPTGCFLHGSRLDPKETQVQEICSLPPAYRWVSVDSGKIQAKKVHWHWPALTRSAFSRFLVHSH